MDYDGGGEEDSANLPEWLIFDYLTITWPASVTSVWPVIFFALSEHKKITESAMSAPFIRRLRAVLLT